MRPRLGAKEEGHSFSLAPYDREGAFVIDGSVNGTFHPETQSRGQAERSRTQRERRQLH